MRGIYYTGIFLVVASILAIVLLILFPQAFPQSVAATISGITGRPSESEDRPSPFAEKQEPVRKKAAPPAPQPPSTAPERVVTAPVEPAPVIETPQRFPVAQDIPKGTAKSAIVATFGPPEAMVSAADGQLRELL